MTDKILVERELGGVNRQGDALLCYSWGETDRPSVTVARTRDDVRRFIVAEWLGVEHAIDDNFEPELPRIMAEIDSHDWDNGPLVFEFEIGGVRIEDVLLSSTAMSDLLGGVEPLYTRPAPSVPEGEVTLPEQLRNRPDPEWYRKKIAESGDGEPHCIGPTAPNPPSADDRKDVALRSARTALIEANDIIDATWDCSPVIAEIDAAMKGENG